MRKLLGLLIISINVLGATTDKNLQVETTGRIPVGGIFIEYSNITLDHGTVSDFSKDSVKISENIIIGTGRIENKKPFAPGEIITLTLETDNILTTSGGGELAHQLVATVGIENEASTIVLDIDNKEKEIIIPEYSVGKTEGEYLTLQMKSVITKENLGKAIGATYTDVSTLIVSIPKA